MEALLAACCVGALHPSLLWRDDYFDEAYDVVADGNTAYVAAGASGVLVVDVTNPASPTLLGICHTRSNARDLRLSGLFVYVADNDRGLAVCDVSDPSAPTVVGTWDCLPGCLCESIAEMGGTVYLGDWKNKKVYIVNASVPARPRLLGEYTPSSLRDLDVSMQHLYVGTDAGLEVVNITDPRSPILVASYGAGKTVSVLATREVVYIGKFSPGEVLAIDVTDPAAPTRVGGTDSLAAYDLALCGTNLYAVGTNGTVKGAYVVNVSSVASLTVVGSYPIGSDTYGVACAGTTVFATSYAASSLHVVDASVPEAPEILAEYGEYGDARGVHVVGTVAAVCDRSSNYIRLYDVSDPSAVIQKSLFDLGAPCGKPFIRYTMVYVGTYPGFVIVDIADPSSPSVVGRYETTDSAYGVWVEGQVAYVAASGTGLRILDVRNPAMPLSMAAFSVSGEFDVAVVGRTAYVTSYSTGLLVLDTFAANPKRLGSCDIPGAAHGLCVVGTTAYIASSTGGLQIVDVGNASTPRVIGGHDLADATDVWVVEQTAYVSDRGVGLRIFDVSDPTTPILLGTVDTDGKAEDVYAVGTTVYVAASGLRILDSTPPTTTPTFTLTTTQTVNATATYTVNTTAPALFNVSPSETATGTDTDTVTITLKEGLQKGGGGGVSSWVWALAGLGGLLAGAVGVFTLSRRTPQPHNPIETMELEGVNTDCFLPLLADEPPTALAE